MTEPEHVGDHVPLHAWPFETPPPGFAARVAALAFPRRSPGPAWVRWTVFAAAVTALVAWFVARRDRIAVEGEVDASGERTSVAIGSRGVAVLEPGARVSWRDGRVRQERGEVFYRVDPVRGWRLLPPVPFLVETPAGTVRVLGTCFRVRIEDQQAIIDDLEGRVEAQGGGTAVVLTPGESTVLDPMSPPASQPGATRRTGPIGEVDERLRWLQRERRELERREAELRRRESEVKRSAELGREGAPATGGGAASNRSRFDLTREDWVELARTGSVRFCVPNPAADWTKLTDLGLSPGDAETLDAAYARSRLRMAESLAPQCPEFADGGAPSIMRLILCAQSVVTDAQRTGDNLFADMRRQVAEIRAGLRPMPDPVDSISPAMRVLLSVTAESDALVRDLEANLGPEQARKIVYRDRGCAWSGGWGH
jgi:hypothetical protein